CCMLLVLKVVGALKLGLYNSIEQKKPRSLDRGFRFYVIISTRNGTSI
ncbi:MAG: hypothetical protein ACI8Q1_002776, partial [Parvicella sp.]